MQLFLLALSIAIILNHVQSWGYGHSNHIVNTRGKVQSRIKMGLFDFFAPKRTARASHILVKNKDGPQFLEELKQKINKSKDPKEAFAMAAIEYSACPSGKKGGDLGTFKQGQMVPAFDKVVFNEEVGVVHGPVKTPFGAHLILIDSRSD